MGTLESNRSGSHVPTYIQLALDETLLKKALNTKTTGTALSSRVHVALWSRAHTLQTLQAAPEVACVGEDGSTCHEDLTQHHTAQCCLAVLAAVRMGSPNKEQVWITHVAVRPTHGNTSTVCSMQAYRTNIAIHPIHPCHTSTHLANTTHDATCGWHATVISATAIS